MTSRYIEVFRGAPRLARITVVQPKTHWVRLTVATGNVLGPARIDYCVDAASERDAIRVARARAREAGGRVLDARVLTTAEMHLNG